MKDCKSAMVAHPDFNTACISLIQSARDAAQKIIMPGFRSPSLTVSVKTLPHDLVTQADKDAEAFIGSHASKLFPGATIIGEEAAAIDPTLLDSIDDHEICVIIDPIDGTWNYAHGLATFGTAISVVVRGTTVFGMLYDPVMQDCVYAFLGRGARYMSDRSTMTRVSSREFQAGFFPLASFPQHVIGQVIALGHSLGPVRTINCSVHEYRLMAQGNASWSYSINSKPWDHAAGALIYSEAGGITRFLDGDPYHPSRHHGSLLSAPSEATWHYLRDGLTNFH